MDDGRLPGEMTLEDIAKRLDDFQAEMKAGFNAAKIRDEEAHNLLKFSLEAREALRESMQRRFDALEKKQDEDTSLLKDVLRRVKGRARVVRHR